MLTPDRAFEEINNLIWDSRLPTIPVFLVPDSFMPDNWGITLYDEEFTEPLILLNNKRPWGRCLIHEMLHVAEPQLEHGKVFDSLVRQYWTIAKKEIKGLR